MNRFNRKKLNKSYQMNHGVTLVVAVVIIAILIVFTFSLTLIAYTLYSSQNKNLASMKCAEAANSLSAAISDELTYSDKDANRFPEYDSYLYKYLRYNLCHPDVTWPYYDESAPAEHGKTVAFRRFDLNYNTKKYVYDENGEKKKEKDEDGNDTDTDMAVDHVEGLPGTTQVCIYWMLPEDSNSATSRAGTRLFIEVTCEAASQSYTVTKEYTLEIQQYNQQDATDRTRQNALKTAGTVENSAVNPCGFSFENEIFKDELWVWKPVS